MGQVSSPRQAAGSSASAAGWIAIVVVVVVTELLASRCEPHPVGSARTFAKYEGMATTTARSALSQVETVRLAARAGSEGRAFGPYLAVLVSQAEGSLSGVQATFDSIQPPGDRGDQLQEELDGLLTPALDHVRAVRVAVRRGQLSDLGDRAGPLDADATGLTSFTDRHR